MTNHTYKGWRSRKGPRVTVNDSQLKSRHAISGIKPRGFDWGYVGLGPMQLAFAILAYEFSDGIARQYHEAFRRDVVAGLGDQWSMTSYYLREWMIQHGGQGNLPLQAAPTSGGDT